MTGRAGVMLVLLTLFTATAVAETEKKSKAASGKTAKPAKAAEKPAEPPPAEEAVAEETPVEADLPPHIRGPKLVDLGHDVEINVPEGMILIEREEAQRLLRAGGDHADDVIGAVAKDGANWLVIITYEGVGYVTDTDADQLDASELFAQYQEGTRQQNIRRKSLGVPELFLDGWSEMPRYNKQLHHLVWGLKAHSTEGPVINFFTRILGRGGYLSVDLIDSPDTIEQSKIEAQAVLNATTFKTGARYEDHQEGDPSSGVGLRALVLGGTGVAVMKAAKAGFLVKFLLVFKKAFIFIILGVGGLIKWLLGRKKNEEPTYEDDQIDPPSASPPTDSDSKA